MNLVEDISHYIHTRTRTNALFADTLALCCVATAIGPSAYISNRIGDLYFNVFGLVIGVSGISNKSVAIRICRRIIRYLSRHIWPNISQQHGLLAPTKFTTEGMTKWFKDQQGAIAPEGMAPEEIGSLIPECAIIGDEYTKMFMGSKTKDYLATTMEYLSTLYDGYVDKTVTIARGVESIERVYASFVSGTTVYLLRLMDTDFFIQGNGTRILWVLDSEQEPEYPTEDERRKFFMRIGGRRAQEEAIIGFVESLYNLRRIVNTTQNPIVFVGLEAANILSQYRIDKRNLAISLYREDLLDPDATYLSRLAQNAMKLAGIHCLGGCSDMADWGQRAIFISEEDAQWAISRTEQYYQNYEKVRDLMEQFTSERVHPSYRSDFNRILSIIDSCGGGASATELLRKTRWKTRDLNEVLTSMVGARLIEGEEVRTAGRPAVVWRRH